VFANAEAFHLADKPAIRKGETELPESLVMGKFAVKVVKKNGRHALDHAHRSATPVQSLAQPEFARKRLG
jgi:hypothetical protein